MTAETLVAALGGRRGRCVCPVCEGAGRDAGRDHLSVSERNGRVLVHCHAGCTQASVIGALRERGLWPEPERTEYTPEKRREWAEAKAARERELDDLIERRAKWVELYHLGRAAIRKHGLRTVASEWAADAVERIERDIADLDARIDALKGRVAA